jgi:HEAT repeat protein/DNA-binding MarR family transcriptional regulator
MREKGKRCIRHEVLPELDEALWHQLEEVWRKAEEGIQDAQRSKDGHQQGTAHCLAVERNLSALIPDDWKGTRLTATDLFILSSSAALHDAGKAGDTLNDHGRVSMREIRTRAQDFGLDEGQAEVVGWIVRVHNDGDLEALPPTPRFLGTAEVDVRTLAALFKLADMLHTEYTRVSRQVVDFGGAWGEDNPKTLFRLRVRGWGFDPQERLLLQAVPKDVSDIKVIFTGFEMARHDLEPIAPVLHAAGFPHEFALPELDETDLRLAAEAERRVERAFVGMDFFREEDAPRFKGRKVDIERLYGLILSAPVTLLVGDSGVGKTSLIHAGLFPLLRKTGWHFASTRPFADPTTNVTRDIGEQLLDGTLPEGIGTALEQVAHHYKPGNTLIVLDQFEDVTRMPVPEELDDLRRAMVAVQASRLRNLRLLLVYRSDAEAGVGPLFQAVAGSTRGLPRHYLQPLTREGARAALGVGFTETQVGLEPKSGPNGPPILDVMLDDIETQGRGFYPPYVQMVGETLCIAAKKMTDSIVTAALYSEKGGATKIIGEYLFSRLAEFGEREEHAKRVVVALVRSTGIRGQRSFEELQTEIKIDAGSLTRLLRDLEDKRMIRRLGGDKCEIIHDYLALLVDQEVVSEEQRRLKRLRELLATKAISYDRIKTPLHPTEMAQLYLYRDRITPGGAELKLLLHSCLLEQGPAWYWFQGSDKSVYLPIIREGLEGPSIGLRKAAIFLTAHVARQEASSDLLGMLHDSNWQIRQAAAQALVSIAGPNDIPKLRDILKTKDYKIKRGAIMALAQVAGRDAIPDLQALLHQPDAKLRRVAARALGEVASADDIDKLRVALDDRDPKVKQIIAYALARLAGREALSDLRLLLNDNRVRVRRAGIEAIASAIGNAAAPQLRATALDNEEDYHVRVSAIYALTRVASRDAVGELRAILMNKNNHRVIRAAAAHGLGEVVGKEAIPELRTLLESKNEDSYVRGAVIPALAKLAGPMVIPDIQSKLRVRSTRVKKQAAEALVQAVRKESIPELLTMLQDGNWRVRGAAGQALARVARREDTNTLLTMLTDEYEAVRQAAVKAIGRIGSVAELPRLAEMVIAYPLGGVGRNTNEALIRLDRRLYCPFEWPKTE